MNAMQRIIAIIQGQELIHCINGDSETVKFVADMDIDCDGIGGNPQRDPCFQPFTSLKPDLNAEIIPFIVVPPIVIKATLGVVLGCHAEVTYKGITVAAVVGDDGPTRKIGEGSPALAKLLGINPNPINGGVDAFEVTYKIHVGVPAVINGITYKLQPWRP